MDLIITFMLIFSLMTAFTVTGVGYAAAAKAALILAALEAASILFKLLWRRVAARKTDAIVLVWAIGVDIVTLVVLFLPP